MSDSHDDSLSRRLSSLESDLAGISLAGPAAARRRAAQRTRHQVTGGVLAGVTAVALGVLAVSPPEFIASPEPADSPSETGTPTAVPTPEPTPSATTPAPPTPDPSVSETSDDEGTGGDDDGGSSSLMVPPGALIDLEYLTRGEEFPSDWVEVPAGDSWLPCMPVAGDGAEAVAFQVEDQSRVEHIVEPAGSGAEARVGRLREEITSCAEGGDETGFIQEWRVTGVGDEAYLLVWVGPPNFGEAATFVEAAVTRSGDYVSILVRGGAGQDYNGIPATDDAVESINRLCAVADVECPGEPEREQLYPEPIGDLGGWLTIDDLADAGLTTLTEGSAVADAAGGYGYVGLERDPFADGAEALEQRSYTDPTLVDGAQLTQLSAYFPNAEAARAHYDALVAEADQFTQDGSVITNTGTISGDGYDGTTWRMDSPGIAFGYGAAVSGDVVTVIVHTPGQVDVGPDQIRQLLELASQRIGG